MTPISVQLVEHGDDEDGVSMPGRRTEVSPRAKVTKVSPRHRPQPRPVAYAADPNRDLSATPPTPIDDVDGAADRSRNLSLA